MNRFVCTAAALAGLACATFSPAQAEMMRADLGINPALTQSVTLARFGGRGGHGHGGHGFHHGRGFHGGGYRGGFHGHRGYYGHRHGHGGAVAAGIAGLAAGAIIGGALASQAQQAPAGDPVAYCRSKFKSYNPATGTYLGYDGARHPCP